MLGDAGSMDPSQPGHPGGYVMFMICITASNQVLSQCMYSWL